MVAVVAELLLEPVEEPLSDRSGLRAALGA